MKGTLTQIAGVVTAVVDGAAPDGKPLVRWPAGGGRARTVPAVWMAAAPDWSQCAGLRAILGFEEGDESRPILLGLLDAPPASALERATGAAAPEGEDAAPRSLRLKSDQELILECGEAQIVLRADGRVAIRGTHVLSRSKGINRIKGGAVQIN